MYSCQGVHTQGASIPSSRFTTVTQVKGARAKRPRALSRRRCPSRTVMALLAIEGRKVEVIGHGQNIELDPVLERLAREPYGSCAHHDEAMAKSTPQRAQPGASRVIRENHQHGRRRQVVTPIRPAGTADRSGFDRVLSARTRCGAPGPIAAFAPEEEPGDRLDAGDIAQALTIYKTIILYHKHKYAGMSSSRASSC